MPKFLKRTLALVGLALMVATPWLRPAQAEVPCGSDPLVRGMVLLEVAAWHETKANGWDRALESAKAAYRLQAATDEPPDGEALDAMAFALSQAQAHRASAEHFRAQAGR